MVRPIPTHGGDHLCSVPLAIGLFLSVSALVALCAKHAPRRLPTKYAAQTQTQPSDPKMAPRSPLRSPKELIGSIPFTHRKKSGDNSGTRAGKAEEGFGEGGLWQKSILMGEKCQPPEFSGVIYYDPFGNQISELPPKSPRAGSSSLQKFSFPVGNDLR